MSGHSHLTAPFATPLDIKNPILDIAASFWPDDRYTAFRTLYGAMRKLDDIVDEVALAPFGGVERRRATARLDEWLGCLHGSGARFPEAALARETLLSLRLPFAPWENLAQAMRYDLDQRGFPTFMTFARYTKGAAVAPATVFLQLLRHNESAESDAHARAIRSVARPLALFSYMTHILRDFARDFREGLVYFPADFRRRFGVDDDSLARAADGGADLRFVSMVAEYCRIASWYRERAGDAIVAFEGRLTDDGRFSLRLIWELYTQLFERIHERKFALPTEGLEIPRTEVLARILGAATRLGFPNATLTRGLTRLGMAV